MESSSIQGLMPAARETPPVVAKRFPIPSRPNIEAFRRFGIDEFEIPPGDDFAAMAQVSVFPSLLFSLLFLFRFC